MHRSRRNEDVGRKDACMHAYEFRGGEKKI